MFDRSQRKIPFNKPFLTGKETEYICHAVESGKISGNGDFTKRCHAFFQNRYHFHKCLLTSSGTDALEMAAILLDIHPGDEIIVPSYTFVSTANAFVLRGAHIVFADSQSGNPNVDAGCIEPLISARTKAIVVVHYGGVACDLDAIMTLARKHGVYVVEDAAHAIDSFYRDKPLGGIGQLAAFSFHETKNVISGEGGMLVINDPSLVQRAEIIWEKGTNRVSYFRGETSKYEWVDVGSSFLPSEVTAAFLFAQLENLDLIQAKRLSSWNLYYQCLKRGEANGFFRLPDIPAHATNNGHLFYIVLPSHRIREALLQFLRSNGVHAVFHYLSLHRSPFYKEKHTGSLLTNADKFSDCLLRLPLYVELSDTDIRYISDLTIEFFEKTDEENA
ncbi:MAG: dTDP-4-amino-4,6-dideoxygalactose transaminase [Bacteroidota bacterium]